MKKNLKIIFLLLAVVGILVIALLLIFCNVSLADVSLDTFIGVMVTMIGILVTFASKSAISASISGSVWA